LSDLLAPPDLDDLEEEPLSYVPLLELVPFDPLDLSPDTPVFGELDLGADDFELSLYDFPYFEPPFVVPLLPETAPFEDFVPYDSLEVLPFASVPLLYIFGLSLLYLPGEPEVYVLPALPPAVYFAALL
jgi:hypothetical protein